MEGVAGLCDAAGAAALALTVKALRGVLVARADCLGTFSLYSGSWAVMRIPFSVQGGVAAARSWITGKV